MKHELTDSVREYFKKRENNFGLENASPFMILDQVILPMASALPEVNHKEKKEIVSGLRTAKKALLRVALAGSDSEELFGRPLPGDAAAIKALPRHLERLKTVIDRITDNGEYESVTNSGHKSTVDERSREFGAFVDSFNQSFSSQLAAGR